MGFFDFLKPKVDPLDEYRNDPENRPWLIKAELESLIAQCSNLKAVGRQSKAKEIASHFLIGLAKDCLKNDFWESNAMIRLLSNAAIQLDICKLGRGLIAQIIDFHSSLAAKNNPTGPKLDLTQANIEAGRLAHFIRESRTDEYECYWNAAEAVPPPGCNDPASNEQKAMAHNYAYLLCATEARRDITNRTYWAGRETWHDAKRREFAPECNWEDPNEVVTCLNAT